MSHYEDNISAINWQGRDLLGEIAELRQENTALRARLQAVEFLRGLTSARLGEPQHEDAK